MEPWLLGRSRDHALGHYSQVSLKQRFGFCSRPLQGQFLVEQQVCMWPLSVLNDVQCTGARTQRGNENLRGIE